MSAIDMGNPRMPRARIRARGIPAMISQWT
jgi:hypothetical protein